MNVLFIYSLDDVQSAQYPLRSWSTIQFGISYISSVLKNAGHETRLVVLGSNQPRDSIKILTQAIKGYNPGLICFTAVHSQYSFVKEIAKYIKNNWPEKYMIIGGAHATLQAQDAISSFFDAVCIGEGEYPTLELCGQLEHKQVPRDIENFWFRYFNGGIQRNKTRNFLQELDSLPFPDRDMWKPWVKEQINDVMSVLLGRGCPYDCTYCSNHALRKVAQGKYVRMRSAENILKEISLLYNTYHYRKMHFEVETIALNKAWMIDFCNKLAGYNATIGNAIAFGSNFRVSNQSIDENLFIAFKKANFYKITVGLEAGSERIRKDVLKRDYSNEDFIKVVSLARKYGLKVHVFNMIGLPGESLDEYNQTVLLNRCCQPDGLQTGIFYPYPGTEIYNMCIQQGLINDIPDTKKERMKPVIELPNFSKRKIQNAYIWFDYNVYKGYQPLWKIMVKVIMAQIRSNPTTNLLFRKIVQLPVLRYLRARLART